jgi:hypothetical protein
MGCTLIIGRDEDLCCRLVREHLLSLGRQIVYLPEGRLFPGLDFTWELRNGDSSGTLELGEQAVSFNQIDGVLARFSGIATSPEDFQTKDGQYLSSEWNALMRGYVQSLPCPVVNRLGPELWYKSSLRAPELISLVPDLKFRLPRTIVTTCFEDARAFFDLSGGHICYSPLTLSSDYSINTEQAVQKLEPLSRVLPLYLSEVVRGDSVDAYVVGTHVVFDGASHVSAAAHCQEVADSLGLTFCHLHIVRTVADEWYCLGLDCMPNLFECAEQTRNTIVAHLVEILCSGKERGAA